jgi:hypothetical protein
MTAPKDIDGSKAADQVDQQRRAAMFSLASTLSYVPPVVASFAMGGLSIREAHAYVTNLPEPCWVARAAFGESDIRWMIFREWLYADAPAWFRKLYLRHGEAVGCWLEDHPQMKGAVRVLMMPAINRTLRRQLELAAV